MPEQLSRLHTEFLDLQLRLNKSRYAHNLMRAFTRTIAVAEEESETFHVLIRDGVMEVAGGSNAPPDFTLHIRRKSRMPEVLRGTLDVSHTLASGELVTKREKVADLILFNRIIVAGMKA